MAAADPARRARNARIASNSSWAKTPDRSERTAPGYRSSPLSYDYWLKKVQDEGVIRPKDQAKAAENAWKAFRQQCSAKASEARRAKAALKNTRKNSEAAA